ncbi:hypothetical protein V6N13_073832 [Hibiscus sabdariffa]
MLEVGNMGNPRLGITLELLPNEGHDSPMLKKTIEKLSPNECLGCLYSAAAFKLPPIEGPENCKSLCTLESCSAMYISWVVNDKTSFYTTWSGQLLDLLQQIDPSFPEASSTGTLSARRASLRKQRVGLLKKVEELNTLCGIKACLVMYSARDVYGRTTFQGAQ